MINDGHDICRAEVKRIQSELEAAHETIAELEIDIAERDELISALSVENAQMRADRTFVA